MKQFLKYLFVVSVIFAFASGVSAEEAEGITKENENISFDYSCNTFSITDTDTVDEKELTVMLVKGDYTQSSLENITAQDVYYIGQASGISYSKVFNDMGVKYDNGNFEPGVYTLITSGYGNTSATKTKLFIGNAIDSDSLSTKYVPSALSGKKITYGEVSDTLRVYDDASEKYAYVSVGKFVLSGVPDKAKMGFILQKKDSSGSMQKIYKSFNDLNVSGFNNIASFEGTVKVGLQVNDIAEGTDLVAIPYVEVAAN